MKIERASTDVGRSAAKQMPTARGHEALAHSTTGPARRLPGGGGVFSFPKLTAHPVAETFPLIEGEAFDAFCEDIRQHGQREPILVTAGKIIDGRNRYRACERLGIMPKLLEWDGQGSLAELSASLNFHRRHLSAGQKAAAALAIEDQFSIEAKGRQRMGKEKVPYPAKGQARDLAARVCGVNARYISDAKLIRQHSPALFARLVNGTTKLSQAKRAVQRDALRKANARRAADAPPRASASWSIIIGDSLRELAKLAGRRFRLVFTDPPYNEGINYGNGTKADSLPDADYLAWCARWFEEVARVLTADGSFWVLISEDYAAQFALLGVQCGLHRRGWIVWNEPFGVYRAGYFGRCARHLFHFVKNANDHVFNAAAVTVPSDRQVKYKDRRADPAGKILPNVWADIPRVCGTHGERVPEFDGVTQLPVELLRRVVGCASDPGDEVLDPFNGSGTTGAAALALGRRYLGIEQNEKFAAPARQRLASVAAEAGKGGK